MVWKFQESRARRWQLPRLPYFRMRAWNSLAGPDETVFLPRGIGFTHGAELAVVIGKPAYDVDEDAAVRHIAGFTLLNDGFVSGLFEGQAVHDPVDKQSRDTVSKAVDRVTGLGPCIVCDDDFGDAYDCVLESRCDGCRQNRGWSGSYLLTAEYLIWMLSRFSTLHTGTVISLGASGWDGCKVVLDDAAGAEVELEVEAEGIGILRSKIRRMESSDHPVRLDRTDSWRSEIIASHQRPFNIWLQRPVGGDVGVSPPRPILYPYGVLQPLGEMLAIPASAGVIEIILRPVLRLTRSVFRWRSGDSFPGAVHFGVSVRDAGFCDAIFRPTPYEERGAWFLGGCADGFLQVSAWTIECEGLFRIDAGSNVAEGSFHTETGCFDKYLEILSRMATLLPGDLIGLEGWHQPVILPESTALNWFCGSRTGAVVVRDLRHPAKREGEWR